MLLSVFGALGGSYSSAVASSKAVRQAAGWMPGGISKTLVGSQGLGLVVYGLAFMLAINGASGEEEGSTSPYTY